MPRTVNEPKAAYVQVNDHFSSGKEWTESMPPGVSLSKHGVNHLIGIIVDSLLFYDPLFLPQSVGEPPENRFDFLSCYCHGFYFSLRYTLFSSGWWIETQRDLYMEILVGIIRVLMAMGLSAVVFALGVSGLGYIDRQIEKQINKEDKRVSDQQT